MFVSFKYGLKRELLLALGAKGQWLNPLIFFVLVATLFPLSGMGGSLGDPQWVQKLAPSILWVSILLASILSLEFSFRNDFEEGVFEQWALSSQPLWFLLLTKGIAHWFVNLFPMILLAPIIAYSLQMPPQSLQMVMYSLLLGTPILSMIGLIGVCLTIGLKNSGILLSLILLPLTIPVLIFGVGAIDAQLAGLWPGAQLALLGAMLALSISFAPLAGAFALRVSLL